jgi:CubicO group peptidase (beta-lactamase class C family)
MRLLLVACLSSALAGSPVSRAEAWLRAKHAESSPFGLAPGISVTLVGEGEVRTFGVGVSKLDRAATVDSDTLFEVGSLSKTATALGLATLVSAGKIKWDDPVRGFLGPDFVLGSHEYVSATLTLRDLLTHRSGLAEGQGDFMCGLLAPSAQVKRLAHFVPVHTYRERFDYSNTGWMLAGEVLRAATNASSWLGVITA